VKLMKLDKKLAKIRYPRVVGSRGEAPQQYPDPDDGEFEEGPRFGINLTTGETIVFGKRGKA
jgi:hypothetical protein